MSEINSVEEMRVFKRDGTFQDVSFDKILNRVKKLGNSEPKLNINYSQLVMKVIDQLYEDIPTSVIDELTAQQCASLYTKHLDYGSLASRIIVSNNHKNTTDSFYNAMKSLYNFKDINNIISPLLHKDTFSIIEKHRQELDNMIDYQRDYLFDYFGFKTLERAYLMKVKDTIIERPQHMWMRVAVGIHGDDLDSVKVTYDLMSQFYFTHATPTLFNSGTPRPQLSSCFLLGMENDSIDGIYNTLKECANISKWAGGIGLHIHNVRSTGSHIRGTNGTSNGIVPMLRVFNTTARYVDQGGGKRNGSFAIYLEPHHADILEFLELKLNHGDEEMRARDLFYALWISDLFMQRVSSDGDWSLFCPDQCPGLSDCYGNDYKELYEKYCNEGKAIKTIKARELWFKILDSQMETGTPYMLYKDAANSKSNQKNLGTIKSSNLCVAPETKIFTDKGYKTISKLENKIINVWNGKQFSETQVRKTGANQKLIKVQTSNGMELDCTLYHKFYIETGKRPADKSIPMVVEAKDLKVGMKIIRHDFPTLNKHVNKVMESPYTHGLYCADGTYSRPEGKEKHQCNYKKYMETDFCKRHQNNEKVYDEDDERCSAVSNDDRPLISLYGEKKQLLNYLDWTHNKESDNRINVTLKQSINKKYFVPLKYSNNTKLKWLAGYLDGDGCIVCLNGVNNIQVSSTNKEFLVKVSYMLNTLGISPSLSKMKEARTKLPANNGKEYDCKEIYRMNIDCESLIKLMDMGFETNRLKIENPRKPHHKTNKYITITGIIDEDRYDDTYCFNEPLEHKGIFNGIITGQCSEIIQYSDDTESAVCNLASIGLSKFVSEDKKFDYSKLHETTKVVTKNLNKVIDINYYPTEKCKLSNLRHRPIGIGVQGLADAFAMMDVPFHSEQAIEINKLIFETIYHAALEKSNEMAIERNHVMQYINCHDNLFKHDNETCREYNYIDSEDTRELLEKYKPISSEMHRLDLSGSYSTFVGSPASNGILQFDMWKVQPSDRYDWNSLKESIKLYGLRNSLLISPMPTASTAQILGNNECFEPFTSNIYSRRTLAGDFVIPNKHLMKDLNNLGLWNDEIKDNIIINKGSIQHIDSIPKHIKDKYKIVWEIPMRHIINMAADRGAFVCQSQSMNLWMEDPDYKSLTAMHFHSWKVGLKTGIYYLRRKAKHQPQQFTIDPTKNYSNNEQDNTCEMCSG